jgi:hypothetical protein
MCACECKRVNPSLANWCFVKAPFWLYHPGIDVWHSAYVDMLHSCGVKAKRCIERKFVGYIPVPAFTKGAWKSKVVLEKREVRKLTVISFSEDSTKFELVARNGNLTHSTATFCPDDCQRLYRLALDIHRRGLKTQ